MFALRLFSCVCTHNYVVVGVVAVVVVVVVSVVVVGICLELCACVCGRLGVRVDYLLVVALRLSNADFKLHC